MKLTDALEGNDYLILKAPLNSKLEKLDIGKDKNIRVLKKMAFKGPIIVGNGETILGIRYSVAINIEVIKND